MTGLKVIIIVAIALALTLVVAFIAIPKLKRKKLAQAWADQLKIAGQTTYSEADLLKELKKVSNKEVDTLIDWSMAMKDKDFGKVASMMKDVNEILKKMDFNIIQKLF